MNLNAEFGEICNVVSAIVPVDLQGGANAGDFISLKSYQRVTCLIFKAAGTAGDDIVVTLQEATDVSGAGAQDLAVIDRVWSKEGTLTAIGAPTLVEQTAAATYTNATNAENQAIIAFDVLPEMLSDGFDCINISIADVGGNAQLGCALYLCHGARGGSGESLPSAIVD